MKRPTHIWWCKPMAKEQGITLSILTIRCPHLLCMNGKKCTAKKYKLVEVKK